MSNFHDTSFFLRFLSTAMFLWLHSCSSHTYFCSRQYTNGLYPDSKCPFSSIRQSKWQLLIHSKRQRQKRRSNTFEENNIRWAAEILVNLLDSAWFPQSSWLLIVCLVCYSGEGERGWDTPWRQVGSETTNRLIQLSRTVNSISLWRKVLEIHIVWRTLWLSVRNCPRKKNK